MENGKKKVDDKTIDIIEYGKTWYKAMVSLGWRKTDYGLMSPEEIEEAGYVWQHGKYMIPTEEVIADENSGSVKKGQKISRPTMQFINWYQKRNERLTILASRTQQVEQNFEQVQQIKDSNIQQDLLEEKDIPF